MNSKTKELYDVALQSRSHSYSPYSGHKVGAAIRLSNGKVFGGCNIENSSFGATTCAEQVAIHKAISELGKIEIEEVLVVTDANPPWPPCGICRQVISEFGKKVVLHTSNLEGEVKTIPFTNIFPQGFTPDYLDR